MTAVSAYAPTRRNSFLVRHPEAIQRRSSRLRRRRSASLAFLLLVIRFWDSPALQRVWLGLQDYTVTRRLMESGFGQVLIRRSTTVCDLVSRVLQTILEGLQNCSTRQLGDSSLPGDRTLNAQNRPENNIARVYENQRLIHSILIYWFGQYTPDNSQKKLWMIASSSVDQRVRVDSEIVDKFEHVIVNLANGMRTEWCTDTTLYGYNGKVAAIVALDQFSRHVRRHYDSIADKECPIPPQKELDNLAYSIAQSFTSQHQNEIGCGMVPLPMYVFALMPYRHASTLSSVRYVQDCIEDCASMEKEMDGMIRRFRKATNRRMAVLQDEARRLGTSKKSDEEASEGEHSGESTADSTNCSAEGDSHERVYPDEDILETFPFEADMTNASDHVVHRTVKSFLADRGINATRKAKNGNTLSSTTLSPVIVSLSGGVDSMVIASVLSHLARECDYNLHMVAIHIDYANRPESGAEAAYVEQYCHRLGIEFKCRVINEVTRGKTARDNYERIAREARYGIYRQTVEECKDVVTGTATVMLGHHKGDVVENVLSNSLKGCGPLDLSGMTSVSRNDGVLIYRPLLPLEKNDIYDYAHKFGVPYFKDTTPHWSTRGKLRNKLLPLLQEIYGEGSMENLSSLANESDEARELLQNAVLGPFLNQVQHHPMGISFETKPWKSQGLFFWKFVLREALHGAGLGMFSDKSVVAFLGRIQEKTLKRGWLQCRRDYAVFLQDDGKVFVLYPDSFPFRKADEYSCVGQVVPFGKENGLRVGPWLVTSAVVPTSLVTTEANAEALLEAKAIKTMDKFMDGCIEYYIKAPLCSKDGSSSDGAFPRELVVCGQYNRQSRPQAWKNSDLKIQSTLPLLGNEKAATVEAKTYGSDWVLVKVKLIRDGADCGTDEADGLRKLASLIETKQTVEDERNTSFGSTISDHDRAVELCEDLNQLFPSHD